MSSLLGGKTIEKLRGVKRAFLWVAVCILILEVVIGAFLILGATFGEGVGKAQLTLFMTAIVLFIAINNFNCLERGNSLVQICALLCFISNLVWLLLGVLMIWGVIETYGASLGVIGKITGLAGCTSLAGFLTSNTLLIEETVPPVKPLKVTALICELYFCSYWCVIVLGGNFGFENDSWRWAALSGLAALAYLITVIAASVISKGNKKANIKKDDLVDEVKKNTDMQAAIRDMVEKEVQARLKSEKEKAEREAMPPLQSDDMLPNVKHDNEIIIEKPEDYTGSN